MKLSAFITKVRYTLQDAAKRRWTDAEIEEYTNDGLKRIAKETLFNLIKHPVSVVSGTTDYILPEKAIRIESIDTTQEHKIVDGQTLRFTDPTDEDIEVIFVGYTVAVSVATDTDIPLPDDLINALKYFVLSQSYEKEDSIENFSKAQYFNAKYEEEISIDLPRLEGMEEVGLYKQDYL